MLAKALNISGPFNIQFIAAENHLKVIECNVRASRSLPFVAKVTKEPLMAKMVDALFKKGTPAPYETLEMGWVGVKSPLFSYHRMKGSDPVASVEMASTGEVACLGDDLFEAFLSSFLASEQKISGKRVLVSIGGEQKAKFLPLIKALEEKGYDFFATENTHAFLAQAGIGSTFVYKASDEKEPSVLSLISKKKVDLIITIPRKDSPRSFDGDGYKIRRLAIDCKIPLVTNAQLAHLLLLSLSEKEPAALPIKAWQEYSL
jgi:carbamoyl-phosphate synthase large subunit